MKITKEHTPALWQIAMNAAKVGEWGDGQILDAIFQIIERFMPLIMNCFPAAARRQFLRACRNPTRFQERRLLRLCEEQSVLVAGIADEDRLALPEATASGVFAALAMASDAELNAAFDEALAAKKGV